MTIAPLYPETNNTRLDIYDLYLHILDEGGITYDTATGEQPNSGYAVGCYESRQHVQRIESFTSRDLLEWIYDNLDLLSHPNTYLGAWIEDRMVYLDVSIVLPTLEQALECARQHEQLAIYNLATGETIYLDEEQEAA